MPERKANSNPQAGSAVAVRRPERWDEPFSRDMTDADVDRILRAKPFRDIDQSEFPKPLALRDILKNDCRLRRYKHGELVVRQGDYGSSAFIILDGAVRVVLEPALPPTILGRRTPHRKGVWAALAQLWRQPGIPEVRAVSSRRDETVTLGADRDHVVLADVHAVLKRHRTERMSVYEGKVESGYLFGEIGALTRSARSASIFADGAAELLEVRWQGLRDIMHSAAAVRALVESSYRKNKLRVTLRQHPLFNKERVTDDTLVALATESQIESYGRFDWVGPFRRIAKMSPAERLKREPLIVQEGHYPNGIVLILAGFARESRQHGNGERTTGYLGTLGVHGLREVYHNFQHPDDAVPLQTSLRAVGYVTALVVPTRQLEKHILPNLPDALKPRPLKGNLRADDAGKRPRAARRAMDTELLEFLVESRVINGRQTMIIDLDRCTRCDDCVRACADAHDGNPRFVRHGPQHGRYMFANACMHCADPVCMIGCPTGAIHQTSEGGLVVINDQTCIGCQTCANNCPYHNIRMVELRDPDGTPLVDEATHKPILEATKCDLCVDQPGGPACQRACPHDALVRIDLSTPGTLTQWSRER